MTRKADNTKPRKTVIRKLTLRDLDVRSQKARDVKGGGFTQVTCSAATGGGS